MYLTTRGLVLRTTEYKETDRILTILTDHDGLLSVKARGVRSNRSKLKGACQLLTYAEFTISDARGFTAITCCCCRLRAILPSWRRFCRRRMRRARRCCL